MREEKEKKGGAKTPNKRNIERPAHPKKAPKSTSNRMGYSSTDTYEKSARRDEKEKKGGNRSEKSEGRLLTAALGRKRAKNAVGKTPHHGQARGTKRRQNREKGDQKKEAGREAAGTTCQGKRKRFSKVEKKSFNGAQRPDLGNGHMIVDRR